MKCAGRATFAEGAICNQMEALARALQVAWNAEGTFVRVVKKIGSF